ncbi:MAG: zf-HC2 domain-containing protein [bacterium]|nr:zf-HC2 domain-containing protein [bacterium]
MKNCDNIKLLIQAFVDNELSSDEQKILDSHIKECQDCKTELENATILNKLLKDNIKKVDLPPYFEAKLWARIEREKSRKFSFAKLIPITVSLICVIFVAVFSFPHLKTGKPDIYIVSPEVNSIVPDNDVTISAAFYNKPKSQEAQILINDEVVAREKESDQIIYTSDKNMKEGYYKMKIQLIDKNNKVVKQKEQVFYVVPDGKDSEL